MGAQEQGAGEDGKRDLSEDGKQEQKLKRHLLAVN